MKYIVGNLIKYVPIGKTDKYYIGQVLGVSNAPYQEYFMQWTEYSVEYSVNGKKKENKPNYNEKKFIEENTILVGKIDVSREACIKEVV